MARLARWGAIGTVAAAVVLVPAGLATGGATEPSSGAAARATGCKSKPGLSVVKNGPRTKKRVAITFDDGPSPGTSRLLSVLEAGNVKATFFPMGNKLDRRPGVVKRAVREGHEFQNHSHTHADLGNGGSQATEEMRKATTAIRGATGFTPCVFRPPFDSVGGDLTRRARALGLRTVAADVLPLDYEDPPAGTIVSRVLDATRPGSIIVLHDGQADGDGSRPNTTAAVATIIKRLKARGYRFVTVTKILGYRRTSG
ncbi:MAG TPA: polysaccharide deacetylase family protein [Thermoleophilaceae bacterium]|nr:polysaccharide deacetylase family protein [Thermoleophilaceae bacterium]